MAERRTFDADPAHAIAFEDTPVRWHRGLIGQRDALREAAKKLEASRKDHERYEAMPAHRQRRVDLNRNGSDWRWALRKGQRLIDRHKPRPFRVSSASLGRALAIVNAIAIAVQVRSFTFEEDQSIGRLVVKGHGGLAAVRIVERLEETMEKVKRYDGKYEAEKRRNPTGVLKLSLDKSYGSTIDFTDSPARPLETQIPRILEGIYSLIVRCRIQHREAEYEQEKRKLEEVARARAAEIRREEERKAALEAKHRRALIRQSRRWKQAAAIRAYVEHMGYQGVSTPNAQSGFNDWERWALNVASDLDPTAALLAALSGEDGAGEASTD